MFIIIGLLGHFLLGKRCRESAEPEKGARDSNRKMYAGIVTSLSS